MANQSIYDAFQRMWQHVVAVVSSKSDLDHTHDDVYETKVDAQIKYDELKNKSVNAD